MRTRIMILLLASVLPAAAPSAEDYSALAIEAIENVTWDFEEDWAFNETKLEEGQLWVGRYDPRLPLDRRWTLLSVDGREPTDEEMQEYLDEQDEPSDSDERNMEAIIEPDTLELLEETEDHWRFTFVPDEDGEDFLAHVDATLKIAKGEHPYLQEIDLRSKKPFKPGFGIKMKEFLTRLTFGPIAEEGPVVPRSVDIKVSGRAFLVINFDQATTRAYTDFEYAGD